MHWQLDVGLVFRFVFLEPGPVIVSLQPAKEIDPLFWVSDERRINVSVNRWNVDRVTPELLWFSMNIFDCGTNESINFSKTFLSVIF